MTTLPYGAWPSPITAETVARSGVTLGFVSLHGEEVWWQEGRPAEGGRVTVVRRDAGGQTRDALPAPWSARSRVHEYGGRSWLPTNAGLVFAHFDDQRLYLAVEGSDPRPLTPQPPRPASLRYCDLVADPGGNQVWCVRESHRDGRVQRHVVTVPLDGSAADDPAAVTEVVGGSDFLAFPRLSPDGRHLAWVAWDHPRMPWDGTELRVGALDATGRVEDWRVLLGGATESVLQPEWADNESVYAVSDRSGWWNLYRVDHGGGAPQPLCPREEEFTGPLWMLGATTYGRLEDGRLLVTRAGAVPRLGVLDPDTGALTDLELPWTAFLPFLVVEGDRAVTLAGSPTRPTSVLLVDVAAGTAEPLRAALDEVPEPAYLPEIRAETLPGPDGREVHALVSPPRHPDTTGLAHELPPYVVFVHGGPTSAVAPLLSLYKAYFTSRGLGVIDVNYGGSTGYGRAYRERLRGQWGVVDVEDCVAAVRALVERGDADGTRLVIRGGSAGGWTTLAALTGTDAFAAGASYYGVAELLRFAQDTHDFESRYLDGLVGPLPEARETYVARAPLSHVDELSCPVLLLQGLEDEVVPPSQAELFRDALARKGIRHAYLAFEGEQHGFRRAETVVAALEAELSFYGQVLGFDPPGVPVLQLH